MTPISPAAAADVLGVSVRTLDRYVERGLLHPLYTPGGHRRFDPAEVDHLLTRKVVAEDA
jgi:excisionase family DNA binding protein